MLQCVLIHVIRVVAVVLVAPNERCEAKTFAANTVHRVIS